MARSARRKGQAPARRLTATIDAIAAGGDGVARIEGASVFVPLTAPGDVAVIDVAGERGTLIDLLEASPHRTPPPCPYYGRCGGCALQHVTPAFQRDWKRARLGDALAREGLAGARVAETIATPEASRRRSVFAVRKSAGRTRLGFNARRSSEVVDIERCLILQPDLGARLAPLRALAALVAAPAFDCAASLCDNGLDIAISAPAPADARTRLALIDAARASGAARLSAGGETIVEFAPPVVRFGGVAATAPPGAFLQASLEGEAALIALVLAGAKGARRIADLFSGCGTFALPLAGEATVTAVDSDRSALAALVQGAADAQRAGMRINPPTTVVRNLFERPLAAKELDAFDAIVFDPPRAGAQAQAQEIAKSRTPTVIAVSCNPASFARDAAILVRGGYALSQATPIDQFVHSAHVEAVGVFHRG